MQKFLSAILVGSIFFLVSPMGEARAEMAGKTLKQAKVVGKAALYGFGGGLVVGLASQVFKREARNIFMFGSIGMYAGILLGIYVISTAPGPTPYEGPDTYEDFSWNRPSPLATGAAALVARRDTAASQVAGSFQLNFLRLQF